MYIRRIKIRNVRGFKEVDLDLSRPDGSLQGWTVLAGRNGSGKSTLLKAIALAVSGPEKAPVLCESFFDWIRVDQDDAEVRVHLEEDFGDFAVDTAGWARLHWKRAAEGREPALTGKLSEQLELLQTNLGEGLWTTMDEAFFLAAYGPYRRLTGHSSDAQRLMAGSTPVARAVSLFREDASLIESVLWLRELYLRRLEQRPRAAELEDGVIRLLNDGLLPDNTFIDKIDSDGLWVRQHEVRLPLQELGDGYRTIAALVLDILRHLFACFGDLSIREVVDEHGEHQKVTHRGVVLIDEVDLHLHVSWQKGIGFWLKRHFPNVQFIVTTHSPFICQAADPRGLIRLPAPGEDRPVEHVSEDLYNTVVNGSLDEAVLTDLFGLETPYSEPAERLRERIAQLEVRLQTGKATDRDRVELKELHSQLPETPTTAVEQALRRLVAGS